MNALTGPGRGRLRLWMALFFLALAVPTAVLVFHAYGQLKWEAFHQHRQLAQALAGRIDDALSRLMDVEESRSFADYGFLVVAGDPAANFLQRSPLSEMPPGSGVPGLVGYFQVDAEGRFTTPLLPAGGEPASSFGVDAADRARRLALEERLRDILSDNRLVEGRPPRHLDDARAASATLPGSPDGLRADAPVLAGLSPERPTGSEAGPLASERGGGKGRAVALELGEADRSMSVPAPAAAPASPMTAPPATVSLKKDAARRDAGREANSADEVAPKLQAQAAFDRLKADSEEPAARKRAAPGSIGRVEDIDIVSRLFERQAQEASAVPEQRAAQAPPNPARRAARKEKSVLPEAESRPAGGAHARIRTFESELDPFEFSLLDSGHFVLFRKVWREGRRFIQGALVEQRPFLDEIVGRAFHSSALTRASNIAVAWDGDVLWALSAARERYALTSAEDLAGALLHRERMSAPFSNLELVFTVAQLPTGPGARVVAWVAAVIAVVLCGGLVLMYRLGVRQLDLARQQQDFVSAVSHELRTPLTSIRMYAEMLREGWASEEKKRSYYAYIFDESERLSRLITNVLQLARMTRNEFAVQASPVAIGTLMDGVASKVSSQAERAGFTLAIDCDAALRAARVAVDEDAFSQIVINLVDNALKFAATSPKKRVEIRCGPGPRQHAVFTVRDYGPGVPRDQMKKIFRLFYRSRGELTRETVGTGIGLALVNELARAMGARVDVANVDPGAVFSLSVPLASGVQEAAGPGA